MHCRFEIVGYLNTPIIKGKKIYKRLLIKKVKEEDIKEPKDVALLMQYDKKFIIMGNKNAITYKEIFPYIKDNRLWNGYTSLNGGRWMIMPKDIEVQSDKVKVNSNGEKTLNIAGVCWFTNLEHQHRTEPIDLYKRYNEEEYPKYDNYDAIEVGRVTEIPMDYDGVMGVPITFIGKYCPTQFEIIGEANHGKDSEWDLFTPSVDGKTIFKRILIKRVSK